MLRVVGHLPHDGLEPKHSSAGVGQASMEETAGRLGKALRRVRPMGIWQQLCGCRGSQIPIDHEDVASGGAGCTEFGCLEGDPGGSRWPILWVYTSIEQSGAVAGGKGRHPWSLSRW